MTTTLADLVAQTQGHLSQFVVNRQAVGTFVGWEGSAPYTGVDLADFSTSLADQVVELSTGELLHVKAWDATSGGTTVLPWFRGFSGSPKVDVVPANSMVTVQPLWPKYFVAQKICAAIAGLWPRLFAIKETVLTANGVNGNYLVPSDVDQVVRVDLEWFGPAKHQSPFQNWVLDKTNADGFRYLRMATAYPGRPIYVTYKAKPVTPDPTNLTATWVSTGIQDSAADLPVLKAVSQLVASVDAAKLQMQSMEQSDQNRLIQGGSASAVSRRFEEMYQDRLHEEQRQLPVARLHKERII